MSHHPSLFVNCVDLILTDTQRRGILAFQTGSFVFPVVARGCYSGLKKAQVISRYKDLDEKCLIECVPFNNSVPSTDILSVDPFALLTDDIHGSDVIIFVCLFTFSIRDHFIDGYTEVSEIKDGYFIACEQ